MYIKIKNIKKFLLTAACIFFAGMNYLSFVKADTNKNECNKSIDSDCDGLTNDEETVYKTNPENADTDNDGYSDGVEVKSGYDPNKAAPGDKLYTKDGFRDKGKVVYEENLTDSFSKEFQSFVSSKQSITTEDVDDFVETQLAPKMGETVDFENLPEVDTSLLKIKDQDYSGLDENERKEKIREDSAEYIKEVTYLLLSNAPSEINEISDLEKIKSDFEIQLKKLSDPYYDGKYFYDMAIKVKNVVDYMEVMEVPETMVDLHVKFLRLAKGLLQLRDEPSTVGDPMARIVTVSKAGNFFRLYADFFQTDMKNYFDNLK